MFAFVSAFRVKEWLGNIGAPRSGMAWYSKYEDDDDRYGYYSVLE